MTEVAPELPGTITALSGDAAAHPDDGLGAPIVVPAPIGLPAPADGRTTAGTARDRLRELLTSYHQALGTLQVVASALLDVSQADVGPITPDQARAYRRTAGEGLALVKRGDLLLPDLWRTFGVERRVAVAGAPLPRTLKRDRRRRATGKGTAA